LRQATFAESQYCTVSEGNSLKNNEQIPLEKETIWNARFYTYKSLRRYEPNF